MSRKNQIDELFRSGLADKGLKYAPEHWNQMESLMDKKRRKMLKRVIWLSAGFLVLVSALVLTTFQEKETESLGDLETWGFGDKEADMVRHAERSRSTTDVPESTGVEGMRGLGDKEADMVRHAERSRSKTDVPESTGVEGMRGLGDEGNNIVRHAERSRSTTDVPESTGVEVLRGLGDEEADMVRHAERSRSTTDVPESTGVDGMRGLGDEENTTEPTNEESESQNPEPLPAKALAKEGRTQGPITNVPPAPLETHLTNTEFPKNTLVEPAVKKVALRPPFLTNWYLEPFVEAGVVRHRTDSDIHTWKASNEKTQPFIQYGLNLRVTRGRFSLTTGSGILQWMERTNYSRQEDHYTFDTSYRLVTKEFVQRPDGSYIALIRKEIDTTSHTVTTSIPCADCPVSFRYITVPLMLQYEFGRGKWLYYTGAGFNFSFLSKTSGEYSVMQESEVGDIPGMRTANPAGIYFSNALVQANLQLGIKYRIHPDVSIFGHMAWKRSLNSMMRHYRQQPDFYGFGIGIEWKLNTEYR